MAKILQFRRDTTAGLNSTSGALAEIFIDTDKNTVVVMDGATLGGTPLAKESDVNTLSSSVATLNSTLTTVSANVVTISSNLNTVSSNLYALTNFVVSSTTTSYTAAIVDINRLILMSSLSTNYVYIPGNDQVSFPIGASINFVQTGAGQTTFTSLSTSVSIYVTPTNKMRTIYSGATMTKIATNIWSVVGDMAAV